jgi:endoribonuclease Dicer
MRRQLETLMHCRIATTSNISLLRQFVSKPKEEEWVYNPPPPPFETELYGILKAKFKETPILQGIFRFAWQASAELGAWCSDRVWALALADDVLPKLQGSIRKGADSDLVGSENARSEMNEVREASEIIKEYLSDHHFDPTSVSSKVELLFNKLSEQFIKLPKSKCIVFTEQRVTAKALSLLCERKNIPNLRPDILVGVRKGDEMGMNVTFRRQFLALMKFRKGEVNCLVSESDSDVKESLSN